MQRVGVVAEPRDLDAPLGEVTDDVLGLVVGQVGAVDVGHAGVAPRRSFRPRPARHLEHREAVARRPVGDLRQRRVREGGGQQAQSHVALLTSHSYFTSCSSPQVRSTLAHVPVRAEAAIASHTATASWPSANVGYVGSRRGPAGGDVAVDVGEQPAERVGVSLDVSGGIGGRRHARRGHDRGVLLDQLVGPTAVAHPQSLGVLRGPGHRAGGAIDLPLDRVLAAGRHLAHRGGTTQPVLEPQQHSRRVVALHVLPHTLHVIAHGGGAERLDLADGVIALRDERVQIGERLDHRAAGDEPRQVQPVGTDVGDGPQAPLTGGIEAPVPVGVEQQPVLVVAPGDEPRLADRAGADQRSGVLVLRVVAQVEADGMDDAGVLGQGEQLRRLPRPDAERLLTHDVPAGSDHLAHVRAVQVVGAGHVDDLDRRIGQQRVDAVEDRRQWTGRRLRPGSLRRRADDAHHVEAEPAQRLGVGDAHEPRADHTDAHHLSPSPDFCPVRRT